MKADYIKIADDFINEKWSSFSTIYKLAIQAQESVIMKALKEYLGRDVILPDDMEDCQTIRYAGFQYQTPDKFFLAHKNVVLGSITTIIDNTVVNVFFDPKETIVNAANALIDLLNKAEKRI